MKLILQSMDRFVELGEFNTSNNSIRIFTKSSDKIHTFGTYSYCEDDLLSIHSDGVNIFALWGRYKIKIGSTTSAKMERHEGHNVLRVFEGKKEIHSYKYIPKKGFEGDITPFHEAEDDDYFLFMAKVINSPDRQSVILERTRSLRDDL